MSSFTSIFGWGDVDMFVLDYFSAYASVVDDQPKGPCLYLIV